MNLTLLCCITLARYDAPSKPIRLPFAFNVVIVYIIIIVKMHIKNSMSKSISEKFNEESSIF